MIKKFNEYISQSKVVIILILFPFIYYLILFSESNLIIGIKENQLLLYNNPYLLSSLGITLFVLTTLFPIHILLRIPKNISDKSSKKKLIRHIFIAITICFWGYTLADALNINMSFSISLIMFTILSLPSSWLISDYIATSIRALVKWIRLGNKEDTKLSNRINIIKTISLMILTGMSTIIGMIWTIKEILFK